MTFENMKHLCHRLFRSRAALVALWESKDAGGAGRRVLHGILLTSPYRPASVLADEFLRHFVIGEDVPKPTLPERKKVLMTMIRAEEQHAYSNAVQQHQYTDCLRSGVSAKPKADRTKADRAIIDTAGVFAALPGSVVKIWADREAEVEQLTEKTIASWRGKEYLQ